MIEGKENWLSQIQVVDKNHAIHTVRISSQIRARSSPLSGISLNSSELLLPIWLRNLIRFLIQFTSYLVISDRRTQFRTGLYKIKLLNFAHLYFVFKTYDLPRNYSSIECNIHMLVAA